MNAGLIAEIPDMAKRKPGQKPAAEKAEEKERIELLSSPGWLAKLDAAASAAEMTRAAYIRLACNNQMNADRQAAK